MAIKFVKKAGLSPKDSLKFLLHQHLNGPEPGRPMQRIHASEMTKPDGMCPRAYALYDLTKAKPKDEWLNASNVMTFRIGHDQEKAVVHWFADMGRAVCHWVCILCGSNHEFQTRPSACTSCGCKQFDYKEVRFESAYSSISCGIDMLVGLGESKLRPVELKTIDKDQFKILKAPLAEHRWRTQLYLRSIAESDSPWASKVDTDKAAILYISKGGFGCADDDLKKWGLGDNFSPFREWVIERSDKDVDEIVERAKVVKDYRAGKVGMPQGICKTAMAPRAARCACRKQCFSGEYPAEHEWQKVKS